MSAHENPYVGPRPFTHADAADFFGRKREVDELLALVAAHRVLLVYGPSGSGKSSLVAAGLLPLLEQESFVVQTGRLRGHTSPPESVRNVFVYEMLTSLEFRIQHEDRSIAQFVESLEQFQLDDGIPAPTCIILDQFEELFTTHHEHWSHRYDFADQLGAALRHDRPVRFVLVLREEYLGQLEPLLDRLPRGSTARFRVKGLYPSAAMEAVVRPLRRTGRKFAPGVAERLLVELVQVRTTTECGVASVAGEFVEPVQLQVVLSRLWSALPPDVTVIEEEHLAGLGGVDASLGAFFAEAIAAAARAAGVPEPRLRAWFEQSFITPMRTRGTVFRGADETAGMANEVLDVLERYHLIRAEFRAGALWYELIHDRFIGPVLASNRAAPKESPIGRLLGVVRSIGRRSG